MLRLEQFANALWGIDEIMELIVSFSSNLHPLNIVFASAVTELGRITSLSEMQFWNIPELTDLSADGSVMFDKAEQPLNALAPIVVTLSGILMDESS